LLMGRPSSRSSHHATWGELRARHDLVEVTEAPVAEAIPGGTP